MTKLAKPVNILLVEDNPGDVRLTIETFKESKIDTILNVARDGVEAIAYLRQAGRYANAAVPDLILLDLNLPKKDGRQVLEEIKADPRLKRIPVIVLTTSEAEQDILKTYDLHASSYLIKPVDLNQFINIIKTIEAFWLTIARLPPNKG